MKNDKLKYCRQVILPVILYGIIIGVVAGSVVFFFKLISAWMYSTAEELYHIVSTEPMWIAVFLFGLVVLGFVSYLLQRWIKSPTPQPLEGQESVAHYILTLHWLRGLLALMVSSFVSFFAGLPLGTEGPSVTVGTEIGYGVGSLPLSKYNWSNELKLAGAGAGFTVAANAPVSGLTYAIEEAHRQISDIVIILALFACASAQVTAVLLGKLTGASVGVLFDISGIASLSLGDIWTVAILGVAVGVAACIYKLCMRKFKHLFDNKLAGRVHPAVTNIVVFVMMGCLALALFTFSGGDVVGSGHHLIQHIADMHVAWQVLLVLFVVKVVTIPFITRSGITGGLFIPMLAIGALVGGLMGNVFVAMGMDSTLYATIVVIAMVTFLGAVKRVPITGIVFMLESTWQFSNLLYVSLAMVLAVLLQCLVDCDPVQDILPQMLHGNTEEIE